MITINLDASEVDHLAADLAAAPARVVAESTLVVAKVAQQTKRNAQRFAPVDTGHLHGSIQVLAHGLSATIAASTGDGAHREYADYVEFGTSDTRPQPFMRPAADLAADPLEDGLADAAEHIL